MQKRNKYIAFVNASLLIGLLLLIITGIGYGAAGSHEIDQYIQTAKHLSTTGDYSDAINQLKSAQNIWLVKIFRVKQGVILEEINHNTNLLNDDKTYKEGANLFLRNKWKEAILALSQISKDSPNYEKAREMITKAQNQITQQLVAKAVGSALDKLKSHKESSTNSNKASSPNNLSVISSQELAAYRRDVVEIECSCDPGTVCQGITQGSGSLLIYNHEPYVLTNQHVISSNNCIVSIPDSVDNNTMLGSWKLDVVHMKHWNDQTDAATIRILPEEISGVAKKTDRYSQLTSSLEFLPPCSSRMPVGSPVAIIGYPAFAHREVNTQGIIATSQIQAVTTGIISAFDNTTITDRHLPYVDYFVSAEVDSGNSGGIALSKTSTGLCILGIPTWLSIGHYQNQGVVQNILNITYVRN